MPKAEGKFKAAAEEYARVINLHSRNPVLYSDNIARRRALGVFNNVVAKRTFSLWRAGHKEALKEKLASNYDKKLFPDGPVPEEVMRQRKIMLSNFFWDYADSLFNQESWRRAAEMYAAACEIRKAAAPEGEDPNTPTLLFNYALSEYRAGNHHRALEAVRRLREDYAYHEKAAVDKLLREVNEAIECEE